MIQTKLLQDLLAKDMDRREFLAHIGGTLLAVVGIAGLIKKIADPFDKQTVTEQANAGGYGTSAYGGLTNGSVRSSGNHNSKV